MKIAIGADHAGFLLKERLRKKLTGEGHQVVDYGTDSGESCDYPDFAEAVAKDVAAGRAERGVLVCSTGVGMAITANKVPGVRAALAVDVEEVQLTRGHNDANVLTIGARSTDETAAARLVDVFLDTPFEGGRHGRRLDKIARLERESAGRATEQEQQVNIS